MIEVFPPFLPGLHPSVLSAVPKISKKSWTRFCAPDNNNVMRFPRKGRGFNPPGEKCFLAGERAPIAKPMRANPPLKPQPA
jgi:hypothetical protein